MAIRGALQWAFQSDISSQQYVEYLPNGEEIALIAAQVVEGVRKIMNEDP